MLAAESNIVFEIGLFIGRAAAALVGGIVGAILTAFVVWFICRLTVNRQPPRLVNRFLRILGGIAGAMAAILFLPVGFGGFGLGFTGLGLGPGGGGFTPSQVQMQTPPPTPEKPKAPDSKLQPRARIIVLGGPLVRGEAFYRFDDDRTPLTLAEAQARLRTKMQADPPIKALDIVIYHEDSLARQSAAVARLNEWATQVGLSVSVLTEPGHIPP
jgi:hypothetical protein